MADISSVTLPDGSTYNLKDSTSGYITGMEILSYGSSTWSDFLAAYQAKKIVYCRASSNSNPASGSQTRLAFMAYVNNATNPTNVEFQYYRSVSSHSATQQGDQVYIYALNNSGTWSMTVREAYTKIAAGTNMSQAYSKGTLTLNFSGSIPSTAADVGAIAAPSSPTSGDVLAYNGAAWVAQAPQSVSNFATPQEYGAVGDGVADDTNALNQCLHNNQFVYIPEGLYRITSSLSLIIKMRNTVLCSDKAMFIADPTAFNDAVSSATTAEEKPAMLVLSDSGGWNFYGPTWFSGVFNCNGVTGLTGIKINNRLGYFAYLDKMYVANIGDDGIGIYIKYASSKMKLGQVNLYGNILTVSPDGDWNNASDTTRANIGLYIDGAHDFSIDTLDINGCTVGIYSNDGKPIHCNHLHCWAGSSFTYNQYIKTRSFVGIDSRWIFDYFYADGCYIGAECDGITTSYFHVIPPETGSISDYGSNTLECYALYPKSTTGTYALGNISLSNTGLKFSGIYLGSTDIQTYYDRTLATFDVGNAANLKTFAGTLFGTIGNRHSTIEGVMTANTWYVIGYLMMRKNWFEFTVVSGGADLLTTIAATCLNDGITINADTHFIKSGVEYSFAVGTTQTTINGTPFLPIVFKRHATSGWRLTKVISGKALFISPSQDMEVYTGSVTSEVHITSAS